MSKSQTQEHESIKPETGPKTRPETRPEAQSEPIACATTPSRSVALSKAEINELPIRSYEGEVAIIQTEADLKAALTDLQKEKVLGFDTETRPVFSREKTRQPALIQLAGKNLVYLIQLNHIRLSQSITTILASENILKVGVAIKEDMNALQALCDFVPAGTIDLAHLAAKKGIPARGLRSLTANLLGFRISKSAQCSNWEKQNLSLRQINYAATDAWVGRELYHVMLNIQ